MHQQALCVCTAIEYLREAINWLTNIDVGDQLSQLFDEVNHVDASSAGVSSSLFDVQIYAVALVQRWPLGNLNSHRFGGCL